MQILRTERLILRPYEHALRGAFLTWMEDVPMEAFLSRSLPGMPRGEHLFDGFVRRCSAALPHARAWAVTWASDEDLVAHVECKATTKTSDEELELIYAVRTGHEGSGIATEAVTAIASGLLTAGVDVVAYINPANGASRRVLQKAGFVQGADTVSGQGERWALACQQVLPAST
ncbi:GNAT family N-acetyltransferase [Variovorax sp. LT1R16]|uniref:GNAT family N-acetyltransferase n=1 Tax=Variovorax sp. LT1R16 TaxID=3443728 RepID=UPI003F450ABD